MVNKVYAKIKNVIKENYKYILFIIISIIILNYPLDYSIMVSGGTININDRIKIETNNNSKGSFNLAYVTELKGTIPSVLLSYIISDWTRVPLEEYQASSIESAQDITTRAKVYLEYSKQAAIKVAYEAAGKDFDVKDNKFFIVHKTEETEGDIQIGDILLGVDGKKIYDLEDFRNIIDSRNIGDNINLNILRNSSEKQVAVKIKEIKGEKLAGISILNLFDYEIFPKLNLEFKNNESGSSGGLMLSLAIYDKLIEDDLTQGLKIVGTGTIDFYGNIGQIDGVSYKLKGAVKAGADVFLAPAGENYNECIQLKEEKKYDIEIIEVKDFYGAVESLKNLQH